MVISLSKYYAKMKLVELVIVLGVVMLLITTKSIGLVYKVLFECGKYAYYVFNYGKLRNKEEKEEHKYDFKVYFS